MSEVANVAKQSAFAEFGCQYWERDISAIPIAPGTKKPGQWSEADGWRGKGHWTDYAKRLPTDIEMRHWERWPDAGIGVVLGKLSGIVALDKDYDLPGNGNDALQTIIPYSPVAKKGAKGWTRFYRYNGERSCSFDVNGVRVLDVLSDGRQTVVPPTMHPDGFNYTWISPDTLTSITSVDDLPALPDDFLEQVAKVLAPFQTDDDKRANRRDIPTAVKDGERIDTSLSNEGEYYREINTVALAHLDDWVPKIVPTARRDGDGYRCVATWRGCENPNVGINPQGIRDWGGGYGMTPIDLVMRANGLKFGDAVNSLRELLPISEPEPFWMRADGRWIWVGSGEPPTPPPEVLPKPKLPTPPWLLPAPTPTVPVILPPTTSVEPSAALPRFIAQPPGILHDITQWITETAHKRQPELALAAAIALCATCMQRIYKSTSDNFTSLYLVMVAPSTEGKEYPQKCVDKVLTASGLGYLIAGSGYTSAGAVFSALRRQPSHIVIIDEIGKMLKLSRAKGNSNGEAAFDKLIEVFGRLDGAIRPPTYSTMTLPKAQATAMQGDDKIVHNPAITLLGATTPATFYESLTEDLVKEGFLGRLIVIHSTQPRQLTRLHEQTPPPQRIVDWCKKVHAPPQRQGDLSDVVSADLEAVTVEMRFSPECQELLTRFDAELMVAKNQNESDGLDLLLGRTLEKAMRLSMIAAKACDVETLTIEQHHMEWAINYVRYYDLALIEAARKDRSFGQADDAIKKIVKYVQGAKKMADNPVHAQYRAVLKAGGVPRRVLLRHMHMKSADFKALIETAVERRAITEDRGEHLGCAGLVYYLGAQD